MRSLRYLIPVLVFLLISAFLLIGLGRNPREIPSPLIGRPVPGFSLPLLQDPARQISPADWRGKVWLLNVWASWCVPCLVEHPVLLALAREQSVPIVGLNYKDDPANAIAWLGRHGNPFELVVADRPGTVALDFGVYGVPETFLIDRSGTIRFKHIGPLTAEVVADRLLPMVRELNR